MEKAIFDSLINRIYADYQPCLLNWAKKKLEHSQDAEDLTQDIFIKIFTLISDFDKPYDDNLVNIFIWRIANFTYLKYINKKGKSAKILKEAIDEQQVDVADISNLQENINDPNNDLIKKVRHKVVRLDYLHREILISFYLDRLSMKEIANKYNLKEEAVKRYLFNTREKLKKEVEKMNDTPQFAYRQRDLAITAVGSWNEEFDVLTLLRDTIMANICLFCHAVPHNISEISDYLSMPKTFLEQKMEWLVKREFITQNNRQYLTAFPIRDYDFQEKMIKIYFENKATFSDWLIEKILSKEAQIRSIGFQGCDKPMNQLLWCFIYNFIFTQFKLFDRSKFDSLPERADSGRYMPIGEEKFDKEDMITKICGDKYKVINSWKRVGPIFCFAENITFNWYGISKGAEHPLTNYIFQRNDIFTILLGKIFKPDFSPESLSNTERRAYDDFVKWGWITDDHKYNFLMFDSGQVSKLDEIYSEIFDEMTLEIDKLRGDIYKLCHDYLPSKYHDFEEIFGAYILVDSIYYTLAFAYCDGKLYKPKDENEAAVLCVLVEDSGER